MGFEILGRITSDKVAMPNHRNLKRRYAICVRNVGYRASLEVSKIYRVVADAAAERHGLIRVIDESGESYLYPGDRFVPIDLPAAVRKALARTA